MLGTAGSGKSTLARQLTLIKGGGYTINERNAFKAKIFENAITSLAKILSAMSTHNIQFSEPKRFFEGTVQALHNAFINWIFLIVYSKA